MSPDWSAKEEPVPYAKLDDPQSLNLYGYVGNNPLSHVDADGHEIKTCLCQVTEADVRTDLTALANAFTEGVLGIYSVVTTGHTLSAQKIDEIENGPAPAQTPAPAPTAPASTGPTSPEITPEELTGKTRSEVQGLAKEKGLVPKGDANSPDHPRKWSDPATNKERLRLDRGHVDPKTGKPYDNPNAAGDHVHGYDKNGKPIEVNGDKHIPTTGNGH